MLIKGNNDLLSITQPQIIKDIYKKYLVEGGSQLIGTNTFSSTTIAQADYKMEDLVYELNYDSARLAREACDEVTKMDPTKPRFVVGAIGPTNSLTVAAASISPDVNDPTARNCTFDELVEAYYEQCVGLVDGGADILIVETIFDTLNAKAAVYAVNEFLEDAGIDIPLFISGTLVDQSGRTLSGQTGEGFYASIRHAKPMCVGLNCALGASAMAPFLKRLSDCAECFVHVYSNAGLPNAMGGYDDTPADMARENVVFAKNGWVNMMGGCCGSTPPHIKAIYEACKDFAPRPLPTLGPPEDVALGPGGLQDRPGHVQQLRPALRERGRAVQHRGVAQVQAPDHGGQVPGADGHRQGPGRGRRARGGHQCGRRHAGRPGGHAEVRQDGGDGAGRGRACRS